MAVAQARSMVAAPTRNPLPFGLLSVVQTPGDGDAHWQNGLFFQSPGCGQAATTTDECVSPEPIDKTPTHEGNPITGADPFTVYAWSDCDSFDQTGAEATARQLLEWGEARTVEHVFWTGSVEPTGSGTVTINPHLAADDEVTSLDKTVQTAADVVTGTAQKVKQGFGLLEAALADCYGGQGVLHVPRRLAPFLDGIASRQGTQLITLNGNLVALGAGYDGSGPAGQAATDESTWIYATGPVIMHRSTIDSTKFVESFDRFKNDLVLIAERTYALAWECCHLAIPINVSTS